MKVRVILGAMVIIIALLPLLAVGGNHKTPTAPKDYLEMKNPFEPSKEVLERGKTLYGRKCKKCHGETGDGKGPEAEKLEIKPRAFTKDYNSQHPAGQFLWISEKGSPNTGMEGFGPGTDENLSINDLWKVITYIRTDFGK